MLSREELDKRIMEYMFKYKEGYYNISEFAEIETDLITYINRYYAASYYEPKSGENAFFQIFSGIDGLDNKDPYLQTVKEIENEFGLDKNIIEVGCGMFPSLSRLIAQRQKEIGKGTITAYDPKLVTKTMEGVTLVKQNFTLSTPIPQNTLIIGRKPCQVTETMLRSAAKNKAELFIKLCDCNHIPEHLRSSYSGNCNTTWINYLNEILENIIQPGYIIENSTSTDILVGDTDHIIKIKKLTK